MNLSIFKNNPKPLLSKQSSKIALGTTLTCLALTLSSNNAFAKTSGTGELGYSNNTGNTDNTSLYASLSGKYEQEKYNLKGLLETNYKSENGDQTEERYLIDLQADYFYNPSKRIYSFAGARFEQNKFENIKLDSTYSLGIGNKFIKNEATELTAEIAIGQQNTDFDDSGLKNETQSVVIAKLIASHKLNEQVILLQDINTTSGSDQNKLESNTGVKVKVSDKANLKLSYKYRNNDNPPAGTKKTDTQTIVTLTYDF